MNTVRLPIVMLLAGAVALAGCEGSGLGSMSKEEKIGSAGGAAAGGIVGYAITGGALGTLIGAAAGAVIGNRLGNWLEGDADKAAAQAAVRAAESGERVTWKKTSATFKTKQEGWARPSGDAYVAADGRTCRAIHQSATQGGETREDTITLCRSGSGWVPA